MQLFFRKLQLLLFPNKSTYRLNRTKCHVPIRELLFVALAAYHISSAARRQDDASSTSTFG